mgnify:CR=1 FL=1
MDTITQAAVRQLVESPARASKGNRVAARQLVTALVGVREALGSDAHAFGVELALVCRKATLKRDTLWQREWGASVSKRPGRGNHHDSWAIREGYVRCDNNIRHRNGYQSYADTVLDTHPQWERNEYGHLRRKGA